MTNKNHILIHWPQWSSNSPPQRLSYWLWLTGSIAILLLSWIMSTGDGRQVLLPGMGVLPEICTLHTRFGVDCPGCGLTRSFIYLAHGNLRAAWTLNPIGLLLFVFVASQIPLVLNLMWSQAAKKRIIEASLVPVETIPAECNNQLDAPPYNATLPNVERIRLVWLGRWVQWNQWMLLGLMLALVLQWIVNLTMGGRLG